jgi:hypothetical protein
VPLLTIVMFQTAASDQLAALSISPQTPPRRRHALESSSSSLESTPEGPENPVEGLRLDMEYLDLGLSDAVPPLPSVKRGRSETLPSLSIRTMSFADSLTAVHDDSHYADFIVSPLSSHTPIFN